jgi:DNA repair photolyase
MAVLPMVERKGGFIKRFSGLKENDIVCFKFWQAVVAYGCAGSCAYCYLLGCPTQVFSSQYDLMGTLFSNLPDLEDEARRWLLKHTNPTGCIVGELQDGLCFEGNYKRQLGVTPMEILIPLFERENPHGHTLVVLSKFTNTRYAEAFGPASNVAFSWSLSLPTISRLYEHGVASLEARIEKAAQMKAAGYRVRFRLDVLAPVEDWEKELAWVVGQVNKVGPEALTVGALRASKVGRLRSEARKMGRDETIFDYITSSDPSNFKRRTDAKFQSAAFGMVRELLSPSIRVGLCKEHVSMWEASGYEWNGCHCLSGAADEVTSPRLYLIERLHKQEAA